MEGDVSVFESLDSSAMIRIGKGVVGRWGDVLDVSVRDMAATSGLSTTPTPVRIGDFAGLQAGEVNENGSRTHGWWVRHGRLALVVEFRSTSPKYSVGVAAAILSTLVANRAAIDAHPLERDIYGYAGRVVGTAYGFIRKYRYPLAFLIKYRYPLAFLILAALALLMGAGRS
jgi:hypothetical protein